MQLFGSLKLRMALLGSSCPLFGRSDPKMGPKEFPKLLKKHTQIWPFIFCFFLFKAFSWHQKRWFFLRSERLFKYILLLFFAHFWVHFLTTFWPIFGPPLGVSLGVSWEPSQASWGSLGRPLDPKTLKNYRFFKVFENAAFWLFEAPDGSLGLILPPLWPIWSQNGPQNCSQKCSKSIPKFDHWFFCCVFCQNELTST